MFSQNVTSHKFNIRGQQRQQQEHLGQQRRQHLANQQLSAACRLVSHRHIFPLEFINWLAKYATSHILAANKFS